MKVSLAGIDAPEISIDRGNKENPYSRRSKEYLAELVLNKLVEIKGYGLNRNDHVLGVVFLEGKNINIEMIRAGLADISGEELPENLNIDPYHKAQKEARKAKRGIWCHRTKSFKEITR